MSITAITPSEKRRQEIPHVTIRFVGDSGDGIQLSGDQFTSATAVAGNELATLPDFPAEIRAPAGSLAGVSGFQIQFASHEVYTPGDQPDVLVCMNPAGLKTNLKLLRPGGILIVNTDAFSESNLRKVGYATNPLEDDSLADWTVHKVPLETLTLECIKDLDVPTRTGRMAKNFFALGIMYWMYNRPMDETLTYIDKRIGGKNATLGEANRRLLLAGHAYGETCEMFPVNFTVPQAKIAPGTYRNIRGNEALALGLVAAGVKSGLDVFLGAYPITPASDVLHQLSGYKEFGIRTFQAEDEIAGICSAIGASYGGALGVTLSSGPGIALKQEAMGLAHMVELPLVICNIQRGGPSTGLPTKTEQADLMQAIYGRNGEAPIPVIAAQSPSDAFMAAYEACRIATKYMTPVMLLSDGYIANGAEPWSIPRTEDLPAFSHHFQTSAEGFQPYGRDEQTLSRPWVRPGTPGLEHRIGGIEKAHLSGNISYDPQNHDFMCRMRAEKVQRVQQDIAPTVVNGDADGGDLLILGWGSTYGSITAAVQWARGSGLSVSHAHLRWLNPLPANLGEVLRRYKRVMVPEINLGQLVHLVRSKYLVDARPLNQVRGQPFSVGELVKAIKQMLEVA